MPENPDIVAQLHLAVQDEMAVSLQDVLLRRTGIGTSLCQGRDCAEAIGRRMASLLGWSPRRLAAELDGVPRPRGPLAPIQGVTTTRSAPRYVPRAFLWPAGMRAGPVP